MVSAGDKPPPYGAPIPGLTGGGAKAEWRCASIRRDGLPEPSRLFALLIPGLTFRLTV